MLPSEGTHTPRDCGRGRGQKGSPWGSGKAVGSSGGGNCHVLGVLGQEAHPAVPAEAFLSPGPTDQATRGHRAQQPLWAPGHRTCYY